MNTYNVEVREIDTDNLVEVITCTTEASAQRVRKGIDIQLNHAEYRTQVVVTEQRTLEGTLDIKAKDLQVGDRLMHKGQFYYEVLDVRARRSNRIIIAVRFRDGGEELREVPNTSELTIERNMQEAS